MTFFFQKRAKTTRRSHYRPSSKTKTWAWSRWTRKHWCSSKPTSPRPRPPLPPSRTTTSRAIRRPKWRLEKKNFNWNFSDANWQVWNRSLHCFAQRNKSELSIERLGKKRKRDFDLKSCHRAASFLFLP